MFNKHSSSLNIKVAVLFCLNLFRFSFTDDIIRLNKKQKQMQAQKTKRRPPLKGGHAQGKTSGAKPGYTLKRGQHVIFSAVDCYRIHLHILKRWWWCCCRRCCE